MEDLLVYRPRDLLALARSGEPPVDFSPLGAQPWVLLEYESGFSDRECADLSAWLRRLPCPVIGLGTDAQEDELAHACDLRVQDLESATPIVHTVQRCPTAAAVLVQVLRITEKMALEDALDVESLAYAGLQSGAEYQAWLADNRVAHPVTPTDEGPAVVIKRAGDRVSLELNRASNRNAMSVEMRDALNAALHQVVLDDSIREMQLSARGRCFSVGGDLTEFGTVPDPASGHIIRSLSVPGRLLARCAGKAIVNLQGACIGSGIEFPAFAKRVVATQSTHFQLPEVGMGLIPGAGGCISIARRMGRQRTAWLALSGKRLRAAQALEWGLVDEVAD